MDKFILTGRRISRRVPHWEKRSKTCWPRKRRRRKRRKRAINWTLTRRKSQNRERSILKIAKTMQPPSQEAADEQSASHSSRHVSSNRIVVGAFVGVSTLVAAGCQRLRDQEREDLHVRRAADGKRRRGDSRRENCCRRRRHRNSGRRASD